MPSESRQREYLVAEANRTLGSIIARLAPGDSQAIEQGRVFVDRRRVQDPKYCVCSGSRVTWYAQRRSDIEADDLPFSIIGRRGDWVVAAKPAAWSCEPDRTGNIASLRDAVASELRASNVHVLTRLDVGVSGLVLIGLSHRACSSAMELQNQHRLVKDYFALVSGTAPLSATWNSPAGSQRDATTEIRRVGDSCMAGVASRQDVPVSLLSVKPITGRKHQIRIHAAHYGCPLLGDTRYGGLTRLVQGDGSVIGVRRVMLHAYRLVIPWKSQPWTPCCVPPPDYVALWTKLGGDPACLQIDDGGRD